MTVRARRLLAIGAAAAAVLAAALLLRERYLPVALPPDAAEAARLLEAARRGDAGAQLALARRYFHGAGVETNREAAVKWYLLAAGQGLPDARYELGLCFFRGERVPFGEAEALGHVRAAADGDCSAAQEFLGSLHFHGRVVARDVALATGYWARAAANGDPLARRRLAEYRLGWLKPDGDAADGTADGTGDDADDDVDAPKASALDTPSASGGEAGPAEPMQPQQTQSPRRAANERQTQ